MADMFSQDFILSALKVSILMGLLLSYLGVHVVGRGIVFVDLALGQISMLGVAFANYTEQDPTVIAIIFTMVGAFLLSFINVKDKRLKVILFSDESACEAKALAIVSRSRTYSNGRGRQCAP